MTVRILLLIFTSLLLLGAGQASDKTTGSGIIVGHEPIKRERIYPFTADPAIVRLPNGDLVVTYSIAGKGAFESTNPATRICRSTDNGATWQQVAIVRPVRRASLLVHKGSLYMIASVDTPDFHCTAALKSNDNGSTWTPAPKTPNDRGYITDGGTGTPKTPVVFGNRIYLSQGRSSLISAPLSADDLLLPSVWKKISLEIDMSAKGANRLAFPRQVAETLSVCTESQIVASPQHGITILPKIAFDSAKSTVPLPHLSPIPQTMLIRSNGEKITFDPATGFIPLPGTQKKFAATYDSVSRKYYALTGIVLPSDKNTINPKTNIISHSLVRNTLALCSSADLCHWQLEKILLHSRRPERDAWQYCNMIIDGADLLIASRTALPHPKDKYPTYRGHDSNMITFHRVENFRQVEPAHVIKIENNSVQRYEITDHQNAPLGNFVLGKQPENPIGIAFEGNTFYIRQKNAGIISCDADGNQLGVVVGKPPVAFSKKTPVFTPPQASQRTWIYPASGEWRDPRNWHYYNIPDTIAETAFFGSAITDTATILITQTLALNALIFHSESTYVIARGDYTAANGTIYDSGKIRLTRQTTGESPCLEIRQGNHRIETPLVLDSDASMRIHAGAGLHLSELTQNGGLDISLHASAKPTFIIEKLTQTPAAKSLIIRLERVPKNNALKLLQIRSLPRPTVTVYSSDGAEIAAHFRDDGTLTIAPHLRDT